MHWQVENKTMGQGTEAIFARNHESGFDLVGGEAMADLC
jgi:hypothetical protein